MSKEVENQENPPEPANQVEVKRAGTRDLDKIMDEADVSYDLVSKIKELRFRIKDIKAKAPYGRIERRELLQEATSELIKAEKDYITSEVAKGQALIEKERKAWMINLQKAWIKFLRKTGVETVIDKQNFAQEWMRFSHSKRQEIDSSTDISQKQKDSLLAIVDKDEDNMITEIEQMADDIIKGNSK